MVVLPSHDLPAWAKIEFRRVHEYAKLSLNWEELAPELENHLWNYGLAIEDVDVYDYEDMEESLDE